MHELQVPPEYRPTEGASPLDMVLTAEERVHVESEGWAYFDRIYGNDLDDDGNPLTQEAKYERLDRYPSPDYRFDTWYTPEYEFRRRAQNAPMSPPASPPHVPKQHSPQRSVGRTSANRIQKSKKLQASSRKEVCRKSKIAPRRPLTRSLDEGVFQEIELDPRPDKVRYYNIRQGSPKGWSYYALTYAEYLRRWHDDRPAGIYDMYHRPVNPFPPGSKEPLQDGWISVPPRDGQDVVIVR